MLILYLSKVLVYNPAWKHFLYPDTEALNREIRFAVWLQLFSELNSGRFIQLTHLTFYDGTRSEIYSNYRENLKLDKLPHLQELNFGLRCFNLQTLIFRQIDHLKHIRKLRILLPLTLEHFAQHQHELRHLNPQLAGQITHLGLLYKSDNCTEHGKGIDITKYHQLLVDKFPLLQYLHLPGDYLTFDQLLPYLCQMRALRHLKVTSCPAYFFKFNDELFDFDSQHRQLELEQLSVAFLYAPLRKNSFEKSKLKLFIDSFLPNISRINFNLLDGCDEIEIEETVLKLFDFYQPHHHQSLVNLHLVFEDLIPQRIDLFSCLCPLSSLTFLHLSQLPEDYFDSTSAYYNSQIEPMHELTTLHLDPRHPIHQTPPWNLSRIAWFLPCLTTLKLRLSATFDHDYHRLSHSTLEWCQSIAQSFNKLNRIWLLKDFVSSNGDKSPTVFKRKYSFDHLVLLHSTKSYELEPNRILTISQRVSL